MGKERLPFLSYLLRLWQVRCEGELVWRASLESPTTGERQGFGSLAELLTHLEDVCDRAAADSAQTPDRTENQ
jgi:hypothetical protein